MAPSPYPTVLRSKLNEALKECTDNFKKLDELDNVVDGDLKDWVKKKSKKGSRFVDKVDPLLNRNAEDEAFYREIDRLGNLLRRLGRSVGDVRTQYGVEAAAGLTMKSLDELLKADFKSIEEHVRALVYHYG